MFSRRAILTNAGSAAAGRVDRACRGGHDGHESHEGHEGHEGKANSDNDVSQLPSTVGSVRTSYRPSVATNALTTV